MTIENKLEDLGLVLPDPKPPLGAYVPYLERDGLVFISGQGPALAGGGAIFGRLGDGLDIEDGARAAQLSALNILAQIRAAVGGDWQKMSRIVRLCGYVNATPDFTHHPAVVNGASELFVDLFGARGRHTRSAVGMAGLPMGWAVEIDAIVEIS